MDALKQWLVSIIAAAMAGTFVMSVSPRGSMDKTVRAIVGMFVVAAVCIPVLKISRADFSEYTFEQYGYSESELNELEDFVISTCKKTVSEEIYALAKENKINITGIETDIEYNAEKCIIIHAIKVLVESKDNVLFSDFCTTLEEKLGVPVTVNAE